MKTEPSSTIRHLKRQFNEIQNNLMQIEQKQASLMNQPPIFQTHFERMPIRKEFLRPSSVDKRSERPSEDLRSERDRLLTQCKELQQALDARNRIIDDLTKENYELKEKLKKHTEEDTPQFMNYMPFNAYPSYGEVSASIREKRNTMKNLDFQPTRYSTYYQERSKSLVNSIIKR